MLSKIRYRVWQFWQSLKRSPSPADWDEVRGLLSIPELALFQQLPIPDQNHSLRVLETLRSSGETDPDLLKAALLHDAGKGLYPLRRWERVFAVLMLALLPRLGRRWGTRQPRGLYRALAVIHQHPDWGADLVQQAGSSPPVIDLVRFHERQEVTGILDQAVVELLHKLQEADNLN